MYKLISWNLNSIRKRYNHLKYLLDTYDPDFCLLQETRVMPEKYPHLPNYYNYICADDSRNGVSIISKHELEVENILPGRIMCATFNKANIVNVYLPSGFSAQSSVEHKKECFRLLIEKFSNKPLTLIGGDFNIVYKNTELTIPNPYEVTEIEIFQHFEKYFHETTNEQHITWWDYRYNAFQRNLGLGLDKVFLSKDLTPTNMTILKNFRAMEEPSDHAPILINFTLSN